MKRASKYTTPTLFKGKEPMVIPKGSTKDKEWAKNTWYINYSYDGNQKRITEGLNRIKDPKQKAEEAEALLKSIITDLENGYNPEKPEVYFEHLTKQTISLADAVDKYIEQLSLYAKPNTVGTYESKLRHLVYTFPDTQVKDITTTDIESYIRSKINNTEPDKMYMNGTWITETSTTQWTQRTANAAKGIFRAFFNWCKRKEQGYITTSPMADVEQKKIRSTVIAKDTNIPYNDEDLKTVMEYLDEHDPATAFFCRFVYSTCMRPTEITQLSVRDIDMERKQITVQLDAMKTTTKKKPDIIDIEPNLYKLLKVQSPSTSLLFTHEGKKLDPEKPYKKLVQALKKLKLTGKGYTLYGFKHTSNIRRFNAGWTMAEIMKANRHSDLQSTLEYLKGITRTTDITDKPVPAI